jgi:hypothetical protein
LRFAGARRFETDATSSFRAREFDDGHTEDVTRWAKYTSANESVCQIAARRGEGRGFGEGAVTAWYLSKIGIATVSVPFTNQIVRSVFAKRQFY